MRVAGIIAQKRLQLITEQLSVDHGIELVDALGRTNECLLVVDHAEQIAGFLRVTVSHRHKLNI